MRRWRLSRLKGLPRVIRSGSGRTGSLSHFEATPSSLCLPREGLLVVIGAECKGGCSPSCGSVVLGGSQVLKPSECSACLRKGAPLTSESGGGACPLCPNSCSSSTEIAFIQIFVIFVYNAPLGFLEGLELHHGFKVELGPWPWDVTTWHDDSLLLARRCPPPSGAAACSPRAVSVMGQSLHHWLFRLKPQLSGSRPLGRQGLPGHGPLAMFQWKFHSSMWPQLPPWAQSPWTGSTVLRSGGAPSRPL